MYADGDQVREVRNVMVRFKLAQLEMTTDSRYEVIIYWSDEDNAFVAEVPELPACMADGATYADAVAAVQVVIREWIETAEELGRQVPEPRGRLVFA
jgi:predicted RNase H-like HicB family nuclease